MRKSPSFPSPLLLFVSNPPTNQPTNPRFTNKKRLPLANQDYLNRTTSYNTFQAIINTTATALNAPAHDAGAGSLVSSAASRATARRLRRARQRLGSYRHDLLVAMRVVNGVELELLRAEWEEWLEGEAWRCEQARALVSLLSSRSRSWEGAGGEERHGDGNGNGNGKVTAQKVLGGSERMAEREKESRRVAALREWVAGYCGSCEADRRAVMERRGAMV